MVASSAVAAVQEIVDGLVQGDQKTLPCKYLYDRRGSRLFDQICGLDAYYPTSTEMGILERYRGEIATAVGPGAAIVEYGAGSLEKVEILLEALTDPAALIAIDISGDHLEEAVSRLALLYPDLEILPVCADFTRPVVLPQPMVTPEHIVGFFPGSSLGNFHPDTAVAFLRGVARTVGRNGTLLLGLDNEKETAVLERAYNDPEGVTAAFNRNILDHVNRRFGTNFVPDLYEHRAVYSESEHRVEMHLESQAQQEVSFGPVGISIGEGETIRTECSYKYSPERAGELAQEAGFRVERHWTDPAELFGLYLLRVESVA